MADRDLASSSFVQDRSDRNSSWQAWLKAQSGSQFARPDDICEQAQLRLFWPIPVMAKEVTAPMAEPANCKVIRGLQMFRSWPPAVKDQQFFGIPAVIIVYRLWLGRPAGGTGNHHHVAVRIA